MEALFWGLRDLKRKCIFQPRNQRVILEFEGFTLRCTAKGCGEGNQNFEKPLVCMDVVSTTYSLTSEHELDGKAFRNIPNIQYISFDIFHLFKLNPPLLKNTVFWDVMLCGPCKNRRFGGIYSLHHQNGKNHRGRNNVSSVLHLLVAANVVSG
jgi:hypothetical protein